MGQDKNLHKAFAREGNERTPRGLRGLTRKSEGPGEMVSAAEDGLSGYDLPLKKGELVEINQLRRRRGRKRHAATPSLCSLVHGRKKGGW